MGLSLLLSTPLLGVGDGHRGDGGSLSTTTMLSNDLARLLDSIFRPAAADDEEVEPLDSNRAISCSIDRGSTARVENVYTLNSGAGHGDTIRDDVPGETSAQLRSSSRADNMSIRELEQATMGAVLRTCGSSMKKNDTKLLYV